MAFVSGPVLTTGPAMALGFRGQVASRSDFSRPSGLGSVFGSSTPIAISCGTPTIGLASLLLREAAMPTSGEAVGGPTLHSTLGAEVAGFDAGPSAGLGSDRAAATVTAGVMATAIVSLAVRRADGDAVGPLGLAIWGNAVVAFGTVTVALLA